MLMQVKGEELQQFILLLTIGKDSFDRDVCQACIGIFHIILVAIADICFVFVAMKQRRALTKMWHRTDRFRLT
jgi:hypothetical protein